VSYTPAAVITTSSWVVLTSANTGRQFTVGPFASDAAASAWIADLPAAATAASKATGSDQPAQTADLVAAQADGALAPSDWIAVLNDTAGT